MPSEGESDDEKGDRMVSRKNAVIPHCGLKAHSHELSKHEREIDALLASEGLLRTAQGGQPAQLDLVVDTDLSRIPGNPASASYFIPEGGLQALAEERAQPRETEGRVLQGLDEDLRHPLAGVRRHVPLVA